MYVAVFDWNWRWVDRAGCAIRAWDQQQQQPETILHLHEIHKSNPFQSEHVLRAGAKNKRKFAESADILRNHLPIGTRTSRRNKYKLYRKLMLTQRTHTHWRRRQTDHHGVAIWCDGEQKNGQTNKSKNSNSHVRCAAVVVVVVVGAALMEIVTHFGHRTAGKQASSSNQPAIGITKDKKHFARNGPCATIMMLNAKIIVLLNNHRECSRNGTTGTHCQTLHTVVWRAAQMA